VRYGTRSGSCRDLCRPAARGDLVVIGKNDGACWYRLGDRAACAARCTGTWAGCIVRFNHAACQLITGASDATVRMWDPTTGRLIHVLGEHTDCLPVRAVPGTFGGRTRRQEAAWFRLWRPERGKVRHRLTRQDEPRWSIDYPDGTLMAVSDKPRPEGWTCPTARLRPPDRCGTRLPCSGSRSASDGQDPRHAHEACGRGRHGAPSGIRHTGAMTNEGLWIGHAGSVYTVHFHPPKPLHSPAEIPTVEVRGVG